MAAATTFDIEYGSGGVSERDAAFAVEKYVAPMTKHQAAQKIQAVVRGREERRPDAALRRAEKERAAIIKDMILSGHQDAVEEVRTQMDHIVELCDAKMVGVSREDKAKAAVKAEEVNGLWAKSATDWGAGQKCPALTLARRPETDVEAASRLLAHVETVESGTATAEDYDKMLELLVLLNPEAQNAASFIQARYRGNKLRETQELTGNAHTAHRKLEQARVTKEQIKDFQNRKRELLRKNKMCYSHPIFEETFHIPGHDFTAAEMFRFKELFANADMDYRGYLGRRQFADLLEILRIETDDALFDKMFRDMDKDGGGTIEFEEFAAAIRTHLTPKQIEEAGHIKLGPMGTRMWPRGSIAWGINSGMIIIAVGATIAVLVYFEFVLVPLTFAYFFTFLVAPVPPPSHKYHDRRSGLTEICLCFEMPILITEQVMNFLEFRPLVIGSSHPHEKGIVCCIDTEPDPDYAGERRYKSHFRRSLISDPGRKGAVISNGAWRGGCYDLFTMCKLPHSLSVVATLLLSFLLLALLVWLVASEVTELLDDEVFIAQLDEFVDDIYHSLNESGIKVLRTESKGEYTTEEITAMFQTFLAVFNQFALILLLTVYLMYQKTSRGMFDGSAEIALEIESSVKNYISLKTMISFLTGVLVAIILMLLQVKMAVLFGLLSFLLNFIPNVGSMIAMVLPMPLVIVDPTLETWQKIGAFVGPGAVQGYVGNALEPQLFGASLNMTPMAILCGLVVWGSIWGLPGAILSVPLLSIQKILLTHANHPMAKSALMMIREDATVDELASLWDADIASADDWEEEKHKVEMLSK